jgi:hypothetical protein
MFCRMQGVQLGLNQTTGDSYTHAAACQCAIGAIFSLAAVTSGSS